MPYDAPHAVSPGLWALAWRRLRADGVAMVSLAIVAAFLLLMVLSGTGLIAKDWSREVGVNYAPPPRPRPRRWLPPPGAPEPRPRHPPHRRAAPKAKRRPSFR